MLTLKKNSMTRIQKYTIPTLMSCVVFAIGTLFDSFWEPFFLAGFSLQAFTYLGLCRFLEDNKAKGSVLATFQCPPRDGDSPCPAFLLRERQR